MEKVNLICVTCPIGCSLTVEKEGKKVLSVTGNTCKRGVTYAENEIAAPKRVLTTTVRDSGGSMISVKSAAPIDRELLLPAMKLINGVVLNRQTAIGDVIIKDILGTGVDIVATKNTPV